MPFLSRIKLNGARRGAQKLLSNSQAMHAAVLSSFPEDDPGRVLWRVDREQHQIWLYVLSPNRPDFTHLVEQAGWPRLDQDWATKEYEPLLERLREGQSWAFRLTANPVHTPHSGARKGKPLAHVTVDQQRKWLAERSNGLGFEITKNDDVLDVVVHDRFTEHFRRGGSEVTLAKATFDGKLVITDAALLRQALVNGVGRGKAYGCGLLTLAPLK
jgi:CRISPR system Cascade subunit CasE